MSNDIRRCAALAVLAMSALSAAIITQLSPASAQQATAETELPDVTVIQEQKQAQPAPQPKADKESAGEPEARPPAKRNKKTASTKPAAVKTAPQPAETYATEDAVAPVGATAPAAVSGTPAQRSGSLTVPTTAEARAEIARTPGAVDIVADDEFTRSTPARTIKDVLDFVPGVIVQPKWGEDSRLSIRGSGLSRNFHLRGIQLYMDGIPINTADGFGDFQEIDPSVFRYVEVFKGANALRFGTNSLGGAINFVMPRDMTPTNSARAWTSAASDFTSSRQAPEASMAPPTISLRALGWSRTGSASTAMAKAFAARPTLVIA